MVAYFYIKLTKKEPMRRCITNIYKQKEILTESIVVLPNNKLFPTVNIFVSF